MKNKGDLMLLAAAAIGGGGFVGVKFLLNWGYNAYQIMFGRFLIAAIVLSLVYGKAYLKITKQEWKMGAILGASLAVSFLLLTLGLQYTTPSVNAFLCNTQAVVVPFICWFAFGKKPMLSCFVSAILTVIGVALLSVTEGLQFNIGALLSFGASITFSFQMAFLEKALRDCDSLHIALVEHLAVVLISAIIVVATLEQAVPKLTISALVNFGYIGVFCTGIYFVLQSVGQRYTTANKTAVIITTESVFAAIFSMILYGERLDLRGYVGCAIIFGAVLLAEKPLKKTLTE